VGRPEREVPLNPVQGGPGLEEAEAARVDVERSGRPLHRDSVKAPDLVDGRGCRRRRVLDGDVVRARRTGVRDEGQVGYTLVIDPWPVRALHEIPVEDRIPAGARM